MTDFPTVYSTSVRHQLHLAVRRRPGNVYSANEVRLIMTELIPPVNWRMCHPIPHRNTLSYQMCYIPCLYTCCYHASAIPPLTHRQWKIIVGTA